MAVTQDNYVYTSTAMVDRDGITLDSNISALGEIINSTQHCLARIGEYLRIATELVRDGRISLSHVSGDDEELWFALNGATYSLQRPPVDNDTAFAALLSYASNRCKAYCTTCHHMARIIGSDGVAELVGAIGDILLVLHNMGACPAIDARCAEIDAEYDALIF